MRGSTERWLKIISYRLGLSDGEYKTLQETGNEFELTRERIRQIESKVYVKLKEVVVSNNKRKLNVKRFQSILEIWIPNQDVDASKKFLIASLIYRVNRRQYLRLFVSLFFPLDERNQIEVEVRNITEEISNQIKERSKYDKIKTEKFNHLLKDIAWPEKVKYIDINKRHLISPKREINRENDFSNTGNFYSEKNQSIIEYESNLEYQFCQFLEEIDEVIGYVPQPLIIPYEYEDKTMDYYPDFLITFRDRRCVLVEIKGRKHMIGYKNIIKYTALQNYCEKEGFGYLITEGSTSINKLINRKMHKEDIQSLKDMVMNKPILWPELRVFKDELFLTSSELQSIILQADLKLTFAPYKLTYIDSSYQDFINSHKKMTFTVQENKDNEEKKEKKYAIEINKEKIAQKNELKGIPLNSYSRWSKAEEELLIARFNSGKTIKELSYLHGRKLNAVKKRLVKLEIIKKV